jgi:two-component sensor histidine kinase
MSLRRSESLGTSEATRLSDHQRAASRASMRTQERDAAITAELNEALAREYALLRERDDLLQRQNLLTQEFEHRLVNGLQLVVSLLSMQSQKTESPEAAEQLKIAARRVGALGRVHRRLHLLDHSETVALKQYVGQLCEDLSGMLYDGKADHVIAVEGAEIEVATKLGILLGFIVNELITNAAKHAKGQITVRLDTTPGVGHCLSVSNDGAPLPQGFHPGNNKGLGLKIIQALVREISGQLRVGPGPEQQGACFKVLFPATTAPAADRAGQHRPQTNGSADAPGIDAAQA